MGLVFLRPAWEPVVLRRLPRPFLLGLAPIFTGDALLQMETGTRAAESGRLEAAERAFENASRSLPSSARAFAAYAEVLASRGDLSRAGRAFSRANELDRGSVEVKTLRGRYLLQTGRVPESLELLRALVKQHPDHAHAWYYLGLASSAVHHTRPAEHAFHQAMRLNPRHYAYRREAAQILHQSGALGGAECLAREALRIAPDDPESALVLARILLDTGASSDGPESRRLLARAREDPRLRQPALLELGRLAVRERQWEEAGRLLTEASSLNPRDTAALYHLAQALRHLEDPEYTVTLARFQRLEWEARQERFLRGAVKEQVTEFAPRKRLASFYTRLGRRHEAAAVIQDYLQYRPEDSRALALAGRLGLALGDPR